MKNNITELAKWLMNQTTTITREVLEERLLEAYNQGRLDAVYNQIDKTLDDIHYNTLTEIKRRKAMLYEQNFYNVPSDDTIVEMKALQYIEDHIGEIICQYRGN